MLRAVPASRPEESTSYHSSPVNYHKYFRNGLQSVQSAGRIGTEGLPRVPGRNPPVGKAIHGGFSDTDAWVPGAFVLALIRPDFPPSWRSFHSCRGRVIVHG